MQQYTPELGQMVHGAPWGEFDCPEWITALMERLSDEISRVEGNHGNDHCQPTSNVAAYYRNDVFQMHSYYWGDCECGWDDEEFDEPHDADCYQVELTARERAAGVHWEQKPSMSYDEQQRVSSGIYDELTKRYGLPRQGCAVHCTCSHSKRGQRWFEQHRMGPRGHAVDCPPEVPNFKYGDIEVRWYKYGCRGTTINHEVAADEMITAFDRCLQSVSEGEGGEHGIDFDRKHLVHPNLEEAT